MRLAGWSALRRLTALLLAVCVGLFTVETAIADVHDGDASTPTVGQGVRPDVAPAALGDLSGHPADDSSKHSMHVCHCVHMHGGLPASTHFPPNEPPPTATIMVAAAQAPASVDLESRLRPPIG
jgi:hypothetical protein